ncbi:MFS transporter [Kitasatospora sp. NBC_01250]|uniref:MFS transporter n=1 Tax=unclassified Kitasatospora TaxID=2633591 RepID=UPI002E162835|nr:MULTISPECIES: MFS transporter [unclassified Kitasatospora]WSJ65007.1 MFS transporter [Kitasatospora sp. NBC_01302]
MPTWGRPIGRNAPARPHSGTRRPGLLHGALRNPNFRRYATGQAVSNTGTWIQRVAQDWLVLKLTHGDGTVLGITTALQFLPLLLLGAYGGVLADRYPRRRILLITQATLGSLALTLGLLTVSGTVTLGSVYALALAVGLTLAVDQPTQQVFIAEAVGADDLPNALALNSTAFNLARMTGPALAGPVIGLFGIGPAFLLNALSYAVVLAVLLRTKAGTLHTRTAPGAGGGGLREGLRYVRDRPDLGLPLLLVAFAAGFGMNFQITTALMATKAFHARAGTFGLGPTALALGAVAGSLAAASRRPATRHDLVAFGIAFGLLETATALMPSYPSFLLLLVPTGATMLLLMNAARTRLQLGSADAMRGRVMSGYALASLGTTPLVAPFIGWLSQHSGARAGLAVGGLVSVAAALAVGAGYRRLGRDTGGAGAWGSIWPRRTSGELPG